MVEITFAGHNEYHLVVLWQRLKMLMVLLECLVSLEVIAENKKIAETYAPERFFCPAATNLLCFFRLIALTLHALGNLIGRALNTAWKAPIRAPCRFVLVLKIRYSGEPRWTASIAICGIE